MADESCAQVLAVKQLWFRPRRSTGRIDDRDCTHVEQQTTTSFCSSSRCGAALDNAWRASTMQRMANLYETLRADILAAVKGRDTATALILRTADAAIQRASMDQAKPIDDALVLGTLRKAVKNLVDARVEFEKGGRADLVAANDAEIRVLEKYLPTALDPARVEALVQEAIAETGAQSKKDMGKVIGALKKHPDAGLLDFGAVSKIVQTKLP